MNEYLVEYEKKNTTVEGSEPHGPYKFNVSAENIDKASLIALKELYSIGMKSDVHDLWNAYIQDASTKKIILQDGGTMIDSETGKSLKQKKKDSLERRL